MTSTKKKKKENLSSSAKCFQAKVLKQNEEDWFFFSCYLDIRWRSFLACIDKTKGRKEKNWKVENFTFLFCCRCCFRVSNLPWKQYELQKLIFFYFCSNSFYLLILLISSTLNAVINLMTKNWNTKILLKSFTTQICPQKKREKQKEVIC